MCTLSTGMYFLVLKKTGEFRPIIDLRSLNRHIACRKFRNVNYKTITRASAAGRLVHHHQPERRVLSCRNCSRAQKVSAFDLIVMARSRERAMFCTAQLILQPSWALRSIGKRTPPYLTNRRCIWEWCSMQAHCAPPCQSADARPCFGRFAGCDRGQQRQL